LAICTYAMLVRQSLGVGGRYLSSVVPQRRDEGWMLHALCRFLRSKVKAKATLECKTIREVILESLKCYIMPAETTATPDKKRETKK
jgi:hypothetical protein